ncbi:hypothetical protein Kpol_1058p45 [Vanderwaltozyma polyspora DSM 70294]|uniref:Histone acetyltransferase type B catalytic subunit n=1 Tax=Vanderwaltozyma polyspora (strain ATCC 22028 / DSM 70294 / BCRC 21397 / CBS 2163 / NBRC 10782 / NRRL Y-8283 / UCD 57-17) TaxID=436907 RepID=A7TJS9_VANPO|nr:uncharacterized protein Kpol_1058p45 [Vanderwaltozyma polyspora DSM 70294]EDO17508.1 hypothetical protein Kpol_1058p45 [Vanderwaltozyma polyspora DSM 70294]
MSISDFKPELWTTSSNNALKISLVGENAVQFSPTFTYPIFGDSEQIFGYQDLVIHLVFDSVTFKPFMNVKYSKKIDNEADDIQGKLLKFLPKDDIIVKDEEKWVDAFEEEQKSYKFLNDEFKIGEYSIGDDEFVVYKAGIKDKFINKFHQRIQIFSLLLIEAASYIDDSDPNWELVLSFNKKTKQCVGFVTVYKYWKYEGFKEFDNDDNSHYRGKISQFLVFPPYQGKGHGSNLYQSIYNTWKNDSSITELVVEDPNEDFDDLRDRTDLEMLQKELFFNSVPNSGLVEEAWIKKQMKKYKIEARQFHRLIEMIMLHKNYNNFNIQVKKRLFLKNYDALIEMEESERNDALDKSVESLEEDYKRILSLCKFGKRDPSFDDEKHRNKKVKL